MQHLDLREAEMNRRDAENAEYRKESRGDRGIRTARPDLSVLSAFLCVLCASAVDLPIWTVHGVALG